MDVCNLVVIHNVEEETEDNLKIFVMLRKIAETVIRD